MQLYYSFYVLCFNIEGNNNVFVLREKPIKEQPLRVKREILGMISMASGSKCKYRHACNYFILNIFQLKLLLGI